VEQVVKIMDNLQICAPRPVQHAIARAIPALADWRDANRAEMGRRADAFRAALANSRWQIEALGAYFGYVRHPFAGESAVAVAEQLAREAGVVTVPGPYFGDGQEPFLRLAFANADAATIALLASRLP
jgi:aspartate/methionine/tyrosine aminotransferase